MYAYKSSDNYDLFGREYGNSIIDWTGPAGVGDQFLPNTSEYGFLYTDQRDIIFRSDITGSKSVNVTYDPNSDYLDFDAVQTGERSFVYSSLRASDVDLYAVTFPVTVEDSASRTFTRLTTTLGFDGEPAYDPHSNKIAFISSRDLNFEIYIMNLDGSSPERLTNDPGTDANPEFSADGSQIVFDSNRSGNTDIYIMNSDGSGLIQLTHEGSSETSPSFMGDNEILFASDRDGHYAIYTMFLDGSFQHLLISGGPGDATSPKWFQGFVFFLPDTSGN